ncbi:hypothetical protein [Paenibacillus senegalensis]|uniref:hypothetical protein n=1 Tax=Paenibacillus senegalensis TaxID=1465766 RepID=UPI000288ACA8|nr:hypothetical protein [Paenibacillus senegalensis]
MRRYQKVLIGLGVFLLVLGIGGYFSLNYVIDRTLNALAGNLDIEAVMGEGQDKGRSPTAQHESNASPDLESELTGGNESEQEGSEVVPSGGTSHDSDGNIEGNDSELSQDPTENEDTNESGQVKYEPTISIEKAEQAQEEISLKDKAKVTSVLLKRLSSSDIKQLKSLASGGLSVEDKRQAKKIILDRLSEEEYNELIAIAAKLGLSQGKTYNSSQEELSSK